MNENTNAVQSTALQEYQEDKQTMKQWTMRYYAFQAFAFLMLGLAVSTVLMMVVQGYADSPEIYGLVYEVVGIITFWILCGVYTSKINKMKQQMKMTAMMLTAQNIQVEYVPVKTKVEKTEGFCLAVPVLCQAVSQLIIWILPMLLPDLWNWYDIGRVIMLLVYAVGVAYCYMLILKRKEKLNAGE